MVRSNDCLQEPETRHQVACRQEQTDTYYHVSDRHLPPQSVRSAIIHLLHAVGSCCMLEAVAWLAAAGSGLRTCNSLQQREGASLAAHNCHKVGMAQMLHQAQGTATIRQSFQWRGHCACTRFCPVECPTHPLHVAVRDVTVGVPWEVEHSAIIREFQCIKVKPANPHGRVLLAHDSHLIATEGDPCKASVTCHCTRQHIPLRQYQRASSRQSNQSGNCTFQWQLDGSSKAAGINTQAAVVKL